MSSTLSPPPPSGSSPSPGSDTSHSNKGPDVSLSAFATSDRRLPPINEDFLRCFNQAMANYRNLQHHRSSPGHEDASRVLRPRVHLYESRESNKVIATIEVPGLRKDEVQLIARDNQLFVSGERRPLMFSDDGGHTIVNELKFGRFERAIPLPPGTEPSRITASMDDGMLTVSWPLRPSIDESEEY